MKVDHVTDVHTIDMIGAEDNYEVLIKIIHQIKVLEDRVSRAAVPGLAGGTHLCRYRDDELVLQQAAPNCSRRADAAKVTDS